MMAADEHRPMNRPSPARTRAMVRARYVRRARRGTVCLLTERLPVFAFGEMIEQLVRRRLELGLTTDEIEYRAGLVENHAAKVEAGNKVPGLDLFLLLVETMGGEVKINWRDKP